MVNWMQTWWQLRQSWSFLRHAYRSGWGVHEFGLRNDAAKVWMHRSYAMAYAVSHVAPRAHLMPTR